MAYYNCHTHIFNQACAPKHFLEGYVSKGAAVLIRTLTGFGPTRWLMRGLVRFKPLKNWDQIKKIHRPLSFLSIGSLKNQEDVFNDLKQSYPAGTRFVALTLNLEHMGAGRCKVDYKSQLDEVIRLKQKYPDHLLPFLCIDPRMNPQRFGVNSLVEFVQKYFNQGFMGIKLYPALGFYPNHSLLYPVYEYAQAHHIPIMVHCDRGGAYLRRSPEGPTPAAFNYPWLNLDLSLTDDDYSDNYLEPKNFELVLNGDPYLEDVRKFPDLKICFAHFGSAPDVMSWPNPTPKRKNNWYEDIKSLIITYPNVFTDISYTLHDKDAMERIQSDLNADPRLARRVLFGTDYYMVAREEVEGSLISGCQTVLSPSLFSQLSLGNAILYLNSNFYTPPSQPTP